MKKSRFTEHQIIGILNQAEAGVAVSDLCREHGVSKSTFYKWKAKYRDMDASQLARLRALEVENRRLKEMYAELSLEHRVIKEALEKNCNDGHQTAAGQLGTDSAWLESAARLSAIPPEPNSMQLSATLIR